MSEFCSDPLEEHFDVYEESVGMDLFLSSLPLEDRFVRQQTWRRIVEQPDDIDEFSECLTALNNLRAFGVHTPPYSAAIDTYSDGRKQYTLQVGHVEDGLHFEELDFSDPKVLNDYKELGKNLLDYFDNCEKTGQPHLTDIARADQYLYGQNVSMAEPKPLLVDLELHTGYSLVIFQLDLFYDLFLVPLEERSQSRQTELKAMLLNTVRTINIDELPVIDRVIVHKLERVLR